MPLAKPLPELQRDLSQMLTEGLKATIEYLQSLLPPAASKYDELYLMLGRYNALRELDRSGVAEGAEIRRIENQIRKDLLEIIDGLTEDDFDPEAGHKPAFAKASAGKQGMLLYQVPQMMTLGDECRCLVRIALDATVLKEDLKIIDHTEERLLKKISKSMQVELGDPSGGRNFSVRTTSKSVQTIDLEGDEYTEWRFYVTPLREGEYLLEVKVSVIELVDGERELREKVLEESVRIISRDQAAAVVPGMELNKETPFKPAGEVLAFSPAESSAKADSPSTPTAPLPPFAVNPVQPISRSPESVGDEFEMNSRSVEPSFTPSESVSASGNEPAYAEASAGKTGNKGLRALAFFLAFLMFGTATTWAVTPPATRDWWVARVKDSPEAYSEYIAKHEQAPQAENAWYRKALKTESAQDIRQYLGKYEQQGRYRTQMNQALKTMERRYWDEVRTNPDQDKVRGFLRDFPDSERLPELKKAIEAYPDKAALLLPVLEKAYLESVQQAPSEAKVRQFLQDFPQSEKLPRLIEAVQQKQPALLEKVQPVFDQALLKRAEKIGNTEAVEQYLQTITDSTRLETFKKALDQMPAIRKQVRPEIKKAGERIKRNG